MSLGQKKFDALLRIDPKRPYVVKHPILRKKAQIKGGIAASKSAKHMKSIGQVGGQHGGGPHRKPGTPWVHHGLVHRSPKPD